MRFQPIVLAHVEARYEAIDGGAVLSGVRTIGWNLIATWNAPQDESKSVDVPNGSESRLQTVLLAELVSLI